MFSPPFKPRTGASRCASVLAPGEHRGHCRCSLLVQGGRVVIPPCVPLGRTPGLHLGLAFKPAGCPPYPVLTPDCANVLVCAGIPEKLVLGDGHKLSQPGSAACVLPMCWKIGRGQGNPTKGRARTIPRSWYPIAVPWVADTRKRRPGCPGGCS